MPFHLFPGEKGFAQANPAAQDSAVVGRHAGSSCVGGVAHNYFLKWIGLWLREAVHQEYLLHLLALRKRSNAWQR